VPAWTDRLSHPVRDRDGKVISTREDARRYILALPASRQIRNAWQHATRLLLDGADAAEVTRQLELALLLDGRLHLP
jgi:hypothetical protein